MDWIYYSLYLCFVEEYAEQDTVVLDDFLTSTEFEYAMEKIKHSLLAYYKKAA